MTRCRLYLITPPEVPDIPAFTEDLKSALGGGDAACLQIRLKSADGVPAPDDHVRAVTQAVLPIAHAHDVAVLMNDRPDLAKALGCDGAHIGQDDTPHAEARRLLGPEAMIGVTCHASRHLAMEAAEAGADYVAFGAFFPTDTKAPKFTAEPELLAWWAELMEVPSVAIGGIRPETCLPLVAAGADFLAVSGGVWHFHDGPGAAVKAFNRIFDENAGKRS